VQAAGVRAVCYSERPALSTAARRLQAAGVRAVCHTERPALSTAARRLQAAGVRAAKVGIVSTDAVAGTMNLGLAPPAGNLSYRAGRGNDRRPV